MTQRPREDQLVAADRLRELGAPAEALIVEYFGAVLDALLWTVDFRHCCAGTPGSTHHVDCRHAELLHRLNPNFWSLAEVDRAWREAVADNRFLEGARGALIGDALNPATGNWYRLKRPGTAPAPPVAHETATGGEAVPGGGGVPGGPASP